MRLYFVVILLSVFLCRDTAISKEKQASISKDDEEIIKMLDMLENYEFLKDMQLYEDNNNNSEKDPINQPSGTKDKEKRGKK